MGLTEAAAHALIDELRAAIDEIDQYADADYEDGAYRPNHAMRAAAKLELVIAVLQRLGGIRD